MGWFWGASSGDRQSSSGQDPLRDLDPGLRDFLAKESPVKYSSTNPPAPTPTPRTAAVESVSRPSSNTQVPQSETEKESKAPPQSLYKDGRYAHLWSTYHSQQEVESVAKSDAEKINDVLEGYKYRKAEIGRAALENCALEQWDVNECFRSGGWASRMTMCRAENKKLERCYIMQANFLKALGYLSSFNQPETDEKIQMHADTLYHRMLDQEAAIEAAKAEGRSLPSFPPLLSSKKDQRTSALKEAAASAASESSKTQTLDSSELPESVQKQVAKRLDGLNEKEREIEKRAILAELEAGERVVGDLGKIYQKQDEERKVRLEQGKETIGDKLSSLFGSR
ncbi:MAG: hypothetical protein M1818_002953 [Claussenomyces sp. TS43310]|nr:MAG: hypothetical protein M1818_002953 [Claussenomyces sp. TS43310]